MKLKPLLFLVGAAGAAAAVIKRRGGADQISQAAGATASRVSDAAPQPVKDAAQQAGATVARAVQSAPEPVQKAVEKLTPSDTGEQAEERYAPPAEALAQEPAEPGGAPSDAASVTRSTQIVSEPGEQLNVPEHDAPEGAVMPDTSSDPLVDSQTAAAMGDAGAIGGDVDPPAIADDDEETFETREGSDRSHREGGS